MALPRSLKEFSLAGKAALVIGAEHPAGRAAGQTLAEAGAHVMLASQEPAGAGRLAEAALAMEAVGAKAVVRAQNAAVRAEVRATVEATLKELGGLDILVNSLDVPFFAAVEATDDRAFERVLEGNFKTVWIACQEAGRVMVERGGGVIVNLSSILAERGVVHAALYCAAKAAVLNLTRALATEWARRKVRVNALEAGWLEEETSPAVRNEEFRRALLRYLPYNRLVKPEELAGALLYLVSPAAGYVTGESIAVDGGLLCHI